MILAPRPFCLLLALAGCGGNPWTDADSSSMTRAVQLAKGCDALCLSDGGCSAVQASACLEPIACNIGLALHRHGQPDLLDGGVTCRSQ
jgi:hypothetical protein